MDEVDVDLALVVEVFTEDELFAVEVGGLDEDAGAEEPPQV